MNKISIITEIINVYDENTRLINENRELKRLVDGKDTSLNRAELTLIDLGKTNLLKNLIHSWEDKVYITSNEENQVIPTTYTKWLEGVISNSYIPSSISRAELEQYLEPELRAMYEKSLKKAMLEYEANL